MQAPLHITEVVAPMQGEHFVAALFRAFHDDKCNIHLFSVHLVDMQGKVGGRDSLGLYWEESVVKDIQRDLQDAVCKANGHCGCHCPNEKK